VKLFGLILDKGLPGRFVKVVADWYGKTVSFVKWNECYSESCVIKNGIRQGGILSPALFNIYADVLLNALQESDYCCHLGQKYVCCIAYADDIILLQCYKTIVRLSKYVPLVCHGKEDTARASCPLNFYLSQYFILVGEFKAEKSPILGEFRDSIKPFEHRKSHLFENCNLLPLLPSPFS